MHPMEDAYWEIRIRFAGSRAISSASEKVKADEQAIREPHIRIIEEPETFAENKEA